MGIASFAATGWQGRWREGDVVVEREVWHGTLQVAIPTVVIEASEHVLVTYTAPRAPLWFPDEAIYPGPTGRHPWYGRTAWTGHGKLTITPTVGHHSVCHFWQGQPRRFACWYLNVQEQVRPTSVGFDGQDLELDIVIDPDGAYALKDDDQLDVRVSEGRWTAAEAAAIRAIRDDIMTEVVAPRGWWWSTAWTAWGPPPDLPVPSFPAGWRDVPPAAYAGLLPAQGTGR